MTKQERNVLLTEAGILQMSAVVVAAPRYMGAFASAIGISIVQAWPWFATVEIASGLAMAVLEGWAIAFIMRRLRGMRAKTMPWKVLLGLWLALIITLPLVATPYLLSSQYDLAVRELMPWYGVALWSFLVAAVAPLVLAAVGYADTQQSESKEAASKKPSLEQKSKQLKPAKALQLQHVCECGSSFGNYQGLNAHKRFCDLYVTQNDKHAINGNGTG